MITVNEAIVALNDYANREFSGYPTSVCPNLFSDIIELIRHLQTENELKARVIREIKDNHTGVNALKLCLTRCRELEDKQCDCKEKARELVRENEIEVQDISKHKVYRVTLKMVNNAIKQKFNLGE